MKILKSKEKEKEIEDKTAVVLPEEIIKTEEKEKFEGRRPRYRDRDRDNTQERLSVWVPKTKLGLMVKEGKIKSLDEILSNKMKILEPEIVDSLISVENDLLFAGQSKGKFGGGKRRAWRQSQKKTKEGNVVTFSAFVIIGDKNGHVGIGLGKAKETLPAREKAIRKAKMNIIKIKRGSGSFEGSSNELHSIPFKVEGKCGSCKIILMPAPQGTGLVIGKEGKKILKLAGIKDIYSRSWGQTRTTLNYAKAIMGALEKLQ